MGLKGLRQLAEAAPQGPWERLGSGIYQVDAVGGATVLHGLRSQKLANYFAALDPATVLALVEAAEAAVAVASMSPTEEGICHWCAEPIYLGREVESHAAACAWSRLHQALAALRRLGAGGGEA